MAKLTLTISKDKNFSFTDDAAMQRTIALLSQLSIMPSEKLTLVIQCKDEDLDEIKDELREVLSYRPAGIIVKHKAETEEEIERRKHPDVTPMDMALRN